MSGSSDARTILEGARTIVAQADPGVGEPSPAERLALETARRTRARVILYALRAASILSSPTPTEWSASRDAPVDYEQPLDAAELEKLGRHELADQLLRATSSGVEAAVWLPDAPGVDAMAEVARRLRADAILVDEGADEPSVLERLVGAEEPEEAAGETGIPILEVGPEGRITRL